jgi:hypothetical protein
MSVVARAVSGMYDVRKLPGREFHSSRFGLDSVATWD